MESKKGSFSKGKKARKRMLVSIKNKLIIIDIILILLCIGLYIKKETALNNTLIQVTSKDYYKMSKTLTDYFEKRIEDIYLAKIVEIKEDISVPFISQLPNYPNGCEATSAVMLLNAYGIDISLTEFINNYMSKNTIYYSGGMLVGPNPETTYAGNPADPVWGLGIYAPGIKNAMEKVIASVKSIAENENIKYFVYSSYNEEHPLEFYEDSFPIVIWATVDYTPATDVFRIMSYDGTTIYTYTKNSHTIVVTGSDENYYYINDPLTSSGGTKIEKEKLEKSFKSNGSQVVGIKVFDYTYYNLRK